MQTTGYASLRVKAYESKLATLNIIHSAVQKENEELRTELEQAQPPGGATDEDLAELQEEFSRRLGSADQTIARLQASLSTVAIISLHQLYTDTLC